MFPSVSHNLNVMKYFFLLIVFNNLKCESHFHLVGYAKGSQESDFFLLGCNLWTSGLILICLSTCLLFSSFISEQESDSI